MKFYKDFLSEELYQTCYEDLISKLNSEDWKYTRLTWSEPNVTNGTTGSVLSSSVSDKVQNLIYDRFSTIVDISEYNSIKMEYYIWQPYSGLSLHDDEGYGMAATIYLNENWDVDYGGMFMWKDSLEPELFKAIPPIKKMMVLNDEKESHMVSTISPLSPSLRSTIQVWFT